MDADGLTNTMEGMQQRLQMTSSSSSNSIAEARDMIFNLGSIFGRMCGHFLSLPRDDDNGTTNARVHTSNSSPTSVVATVDEITSVAKLTLGEALVQLLTLANALHLDLRTCILKKIDLNGKKYPVEHCRGKSGKYTEYSHHTGITQTVGQCTIDNTITDATSTTTTQSVEENHTIEGITLIIRKLLMIENGINITHHVILH
jgi:hypothetical protein